MLGLVTWQDLFYRIAVTCFAGSTMIAARGKVAGPLKAVVVVALAGALSVVLTGRSAMALFGTNVLFSGEVSPVTTSSDENGKFRFAEISRKGGFSNLLPGQIAIVQKIDIKHGGKEYRGWIDTRPATRETISVSANRSENGGGRRSEAAAGEVPTCPTN